MACPFFEVSNYRSVQLDTFLQTFIASLALFYVNEISFEYLLWSLGCRIKVSLVLHEEADS